MTALSSPYIAQERTAQSAILSVRSERFALCLKERHRSQNQGSLKSEERKSDFKERCAQLCNIRSFLCVSTAGPALPLRSDCARFFAYSALIISFKGVHMKLKVVALAISVD